MLEATSTEIVTMADPRKKNTSNGESFGERLARLRKAAGYTQEEFAAEVGISRRALAYYEVQTEHPPAHCLPAIAAVLGVSTDQLLGIAAIPKRRPPLNRRLVEKLKKIEALPQRQQRALLTTIDNFLRGAQSG